MLQRRVRFFRAPAPALGAAAGRGSASQYSCLTRCLEPTLIYKSSISVFPTILPQGEVSRIGEMAEKATLQHLNHPQGSPVHSPTRNVIATLPGIVKALSQQPASRTIPCTISFTRQKLFGKTAHTGSKCRWSRQDSWRWLPFHPAAPAQAPTLVQG